MRIKGQADFLLANPAHFPSVVRIMSSWDRFKVVERVKTAADEFGSSNPQQRKQIIFGCRNASVREVYFGLLSFFFNSQLQKNQFERQKLASTILLSIAPPSPLALDASVYATAQHWDLSVSELPSYWCGIFGQSEVIDFLADLAGNCIDAKLKRSVETMLFWSRRYEKSIPDEAV
jgi:hypothetical protein